MKKILSILTTFTAVSVITPAVVACKTDNITVEVLTKEVAKKAEIVTKAKEYKTNSNDANKTILETEVKNQIETVIKDKLKGKAEIEKIATLAKSNFTVTAKKDGDNIKIKIKKATWVDTFASSDDKKATEKATYELILGEEHEETVSTS